MTEAEIESDCLNPDRKFKPIVKTSHPTVDKDRGDREFWTV